MVVQLFMQWRILESLTASNVVIVAWVVLAGVVKSSQQHDRADLTKMIAVMRRGRDFIARLHTRNTELVRDVDRSTPEATEVRDIFAGLYSVSIEKAGF